MAFFGGNPFSTPVGQRIEQATDAALASENWALNMEICDMINDTEDGPKDAVKALRRRLQQNAGKNYTVVMYALTVLETCVKNCGRKFHLLATSKEFVQELVKLIGPKNDPPTAVQEKVLSLIQSWADAFKGNPDMAGVVQVYQDLKLKGVEFPMTDLDAMAPIHTPQRVRSVPELVPAQTKAPVVPRSTVTPPYQAPTMPVSGLNSDQLAKLRSELDVVQGNVRIFQEMLTELVPGQEHPSDLELLHDLNKTCQAMQARLVELIDKVAAEEVTHELLHLNDELNNLFLRYSRFEKNRNPSQAVPPLLRPEGKAPEETSALIDFGDQEQPSDMHLKLAGLDLGKGTVTSALSQINSVPAASQGRQVGADDEFDMFAQSRTTSYEKSKQTGSTYQDNVVNQTGLALGAVAQSRHVVNPESEEFLDEKLQSETDFDEMEAWLKGKPGAVPPSEAQQESITSTEFDRFLAERAAAAETLPPTGAVPGRPVAGRRHMEKEETENTLFAL